ncbi:hypothetical protein HK101_000539 [Irineochytrium annulatum]|nr:hypothetical protein HK101_000539 [Irineochytrium annulatum]
MTESLQHLKLNNVMQKKRGLKGGFFNSAPKKSNVPTPAATKPNAAAPDNLPVVKPKFSPSDALKLEEVQEAMKEDFSLLDKKEWMTTAFISKLESNPRLARAMQDPDFQRATEEMSSNPQAAFKKYSEQRPDLLLALREFAGIMGDQLMALSDREEEGKKVGGDVGTDDEVRKKGNRGPSVTPMVAPAAGVSIPQDLPENEQMLIRKVMSDPSLQAAFRDPKVQRLLMNIKDNPPELHRALTTADPDMKGKILKLMDAGILSIQR